MSSTHMHEDVVLVKKIANSYNVSDVIYLRYPYEDSLTGYTFFFQRLIGLPGDSIEIAEKIVYRNGEKINDVPGIKHNYLIKTKGRNPDIIFNAYYGLTEGGAISEQYDFSYSLTNAQVEKLKNDSLISRVVLKMHQKNISDESCFPPSFEYPWNMDHYGPLYIPKHNDTLKLDSINIKLYYDLISVHENNDLVTRADSIFIDGVLSDRYVVKKNYYFVLGDNRDNANDSRVWGFLPEGCIIGKLIATIKRK